MIGKMMAILGVLLISSNAMAADGLWITSKVELGYDEYFVVMGASVEKEGLAKFYAGTGVKLKLTDSFKFEPSFGLSMKRTDGWIPYSYFKLKIELSF